MGGHTVEAVTNDGRKADNVGGNSQGWGCQGRVRRTRASVPKPSEQRLAVQAAGLSVDGHGHGRGNGHGAADTRTKSQAQQMQRRAGAGATRQTLNTACLPRRKGRGRAARGGPGFSAHARVDVGARKRRHEVEELVAARDNNVRARRCASWRVESREISVESGARRCRRGGGVGGWVSWV